MMRGVLEKRVTRLYMECITYWYCVMNHRVEGRGSAVITDVIYSSETSSEEEKPSSQTKEKYESIKVQL